MAYSSLFELGFESILLLRRIDGVIDEIQVFIHSWDPGGSGDHPTPLFLENPYIPYQCMDLYLSSTNLGSASMGKIFVEGGNPLAVMGKKKLDGHAESGIVYLSILKDQDQMNSHSLSGKRRYTSNLSVTNDQARQK
ncbi:hypothetical protein HAX54_004677, partial [Datura stramonium]|nr:hypothetical protein [Datura stramonium]